jgi:parvulin-like peptidyl-prolyl isomerase
MGLGLSADLGRRLCCRPVNRGLLSKRNLAIIFGAALVLTVAIVAVAVGVGHPDVPSDDVAVVDDSSIDVEGLAEDGKISKEGFDKLFDQTAKQQGLPAAPAPGDPQYQAVHDQAMGTALDIAWITGEAAKDGVTVTDTEVQQQFQQTKQQNFKTDAEYQKFLQQSGFTEADVLARVRLQLISQKIEQKLTGDISDPSESDAKAFYDANSSQFSQPEQRNIRIILNQDPAQVNQALAALKQDNSPASWKKVAAQYSTDSTSKDKGGVRTGVVAGTFEQPLDDQVFNAAQGQLVGPITTPTGTYVFQVDAITPETTQPFDTLKDQIVQQLKSQKQQEAFSAFLTQYRDYWSSKTFCAPDYTIVRCDNFTGKPNPCPDPSLTEAQQQQQIQQQGCPPPVQTISPAAPGSIKLFTPAAGGQPQKPHPPGEAVTPSVPGGGIPGGGTVVPGGGAPSGGAPTGG